jgi:RNA polymerase sigma-70 factor (ECF subfamily)
MGFAVTDRSAHQAEGSERQQEFRRLAEPFRRELHVHCYRMLGSIDEAEDLVQETYLRAWRSFDNFETIEGGSFRAWLYKTSTNACLNALASRKNRQRFLPHQLPPATGDLPSSAVIDIAWLEPYPNAYLEGIEDNATNPEACYTAREAVHLAFVAAIQLLPPRQRAALLLCDVIGWTAAEAAALLEGSAVSINSALQRARATLANHYPSGRPSVALKPTPAQQRLLERYMDVWQRLDPEGLAALLKEDVTVTMPPSFEWFSGRAAVMSFFRAWKCSGLRLVPTGANGLPAFAVYERTGGQWAARSIHVLTLAQELISTITVFGPPIGPNLFPSFGPPLILPDAGDASSLSHS